MARVIEIRRAFVFGIVIVLLAMFAAEQTLAQSKSESSPELEKKLNESQKEQEKACREQKPSVKRTYTFQDTRLQHPFNPEGGTIPPGVFAAWVDAAR